MNEGDYIFHGVFYNDNFSKNAEEISKINTTIKYLEELLNLFLKDKSISDFLKNLTNTFNIMLKNARNPLSSDKDNLRNNCYDKEFITNELISFAFNNTIEKYKPVLTPDKYNLFNMVYKFYKTIGQHDYNLLNYKSFENFKNLFSMYIILKKMLEDALNNERRIYLKNYKRRLFSITEKLKKSKAYKRFSSKYDEIIKEYENSLNNYIYFGKFSKDTLEDSEKTILKLKE